MTDVQGFAAPGFESVAETFAATFDGRPTMGGAVAVRHEGREVVNLWGGSADPRSGTPWDKDTASVVFSCTKGIVGILAARLVDEGRLDYDAPVVRYWPEFGANGKAGVTVAQLLAHRAGLSVPDADFSFEDLLDWSRVTSHLAGQAPLWTPGASHAYHALTYGWLAGELIRRVSGQSVGEQFRQEIAEPLNIEGWIGLPAAHAAKVAHLQVAPSLESFWAAEAAFDNAGSPNWPYRAMTLGHALPATLVTPDGGFNDPRLQAAEMPGAGGIASASALAAIWSATVTTTNDVRLVSAATLARATLVASEGQQAFPVQPPFARWGLGFQLDSEARRYLTAESFGHDGAGGQSTFADPVHRVGFAFVTNWLEAGEGDRRGTDLIDSLRTALTDPG